MSQNNSSVGSLTGPDFNLPDSILSIIPTDPYDQLDLARKITSMAIASRVSKLESDNGRMRQKLQEKDSVIDELQDNVTRLENERVQMESRLRIVVHENMKLLKERDSLAVAAKKLSRDLVKLETFKKQLMQSLNDDNTSLVENVNTTSYQSMPKAYPVEDEEANGNANARQHASIGSTESEPLLVAQRTLVTSSIQPQPTLNGTPKVISASGSPRGYSTAGTPQKTSGSTTPTGFQFESRQELSWYLSSQQSSAANSPPRGHQNPGRIPRIDGKEFFRQARSRLSYEQFSAFLANIKELNAQKQSREETLRKAEEIFGKDNRDLFLSFQGMLNRNTR